MTRFPVLCATLVLASCGGIATDSAPEEGTAGTGASANVGNSETSPEDNCEALCSKWEECPDSSADSACSSRCIEGYWGASAFGCGGEYDLLVTCTLSLDPCGLGLDGCAAENRLYYECVQDGI